MKADVPLAAVLYGHDSCLLCSWGSCAGSVRSHRSRRLSQPVTLPVLIYCRVLQSGALGECGGSGEYKSCFFEVKAKPRPPSFQFHLLKRMRCSFLLGSCDPVPVMYHSL